jgi:hypothetical protein
MVVKQSKVSKWKVVTCGVGKQPAASRIYQTLDFLTALNPIPENDNEESLESTSSTDTPLFQG